MKSYYVLPTEQRKGSKDDYILYINSDEKKSLGLKTFCVAIYSNPNLNNNGRELKVPCRVLNDDTLDGKHVRIDQTLRNSIGIPFRYDDEKITVRVVPLRLSLLQRICDSLSYLFGRRYLFFRVCKPGIPDLEKNISKIPSDTFPILGCEVGDKIVCESIIIQNSSFEMKIHKIKAYEITEEMMERRRKEEEKDPRRYPCSEKILKIAPDIPAIFLDAHDKNELQVDQLDPLRVRRSLFDLFSKQAREFGIILFLSALAVTQILPIEISWRELIGIVVLSSLFSFILISINIRTKVK